MHSQFFDGPGKTLECINDKFIVDLARDIERTRERYTHPQGQVFWARLRQAFQQKTPPEQLMLTGGNTFTPEMTLLWLTGFITRVTHSHLAISLLLRRVQPMLASCTQGSERFHQLTLLENALQQRVALLENHLRQQDLNRQAQVHCEQVFSRWRTRHWHAFSPAARCYVALEELRWGAFGDAWRLCPQTQAESLLEQVRSLAITHLAHDLDASPRTRHFYHQWLTTPPATGMMELKDLLSWLGDWSNSERQPVTWSVTQSWQSVALGMPRICSALRLAGAMTDEVFTSLH